MKTYMCTLSRRWNGITRITYLILRIECSIYVHKHTYNHSLLLFLVTKITVCGKFSVWKRLTKSNWKRKRLEFDQSSKIKKGTRSISEDFQSIKRAEQKKAVLWYRINVQSDGMNTRFIYLCNRCCKILTVFLQLFHEKWWKFRRIF